MKKPEEKPVVNGTKTPKHRSPNYPAISLRTLASKLPAVYASIKRHAVGVETAVSTMGYSYKSSTGKLALAAMRAYGLFETVQAGANATVKLTSRALDIAGDFPIDSKEWLDAVQAAALAPKIHETLWKRYGAILPLDDEIRRVLIRELGFGDNAVGPFVRDYKDTIAFARLNEKSTIPEDTQDDPEDEAEDDNQGDRRGGGKPPKERKRNMTTGIQEDVFSLVDGQAVVVQWPERMSSEFAQDVKDWLKIIGRKIERSFDSSQTNHDQDDEDEDG